MDKLPVIDLSEYKRISNVSTSKGMLTKFETVIDGRTHYVKTGSKSALRFSNVEPVVECIAYELGTLLGFDCAKYTLGKVQGELLGVHGEILVCSSPSFLIAGENKMSALKMLQSLTGKVSFNSDDDLYDILVSNLPAFRYDIDKMIVFDFLIHNTDRHLSNFEFLMNTAGVFRFAPLFDHGNSLLNTAEEYDFEDEESFDALMNLRDSKPFHHDQYEALKIVDGIRFMRINTELDPTKYMEIFDKYQTYISRKRLIGMKSMFIRRLNHVRSLQTLL